MRALHLYSGNLYGGIERSLVTLVRERALRRELENVIGLCFEGRLSRELCAVGGEPIMLEGGEAVRLSRPWTMWRVRRRLREWLERQPIDAAITHSYWSHVVFGPAVKKAGIPLIFSAHDVPTGRSMLERMAGRLRPDFVIANSQFTGQRVGLVFEGARYEVHHPPVLPPPPVDRAVARGQIRRELITQPGAVVIILTSRLEKFKGHRTLLEALARLERLPQWVCWMASGAQRPAEQVYRDELIGLARKLGLSGRVRFLGQRADVPELLAAADIHCQPNSLPEAFGVAYVEALYAGLPVVSTRLGGAAEITGDKCGILVEPGDVTGLAAALAQLILDEPKRLELGRAGPPRARELCDPAMALGRLNRMLKDVVGPCRGAHGAANPREMADVLS